MGNDVERNSSSQINEEFITFELIQSSLGIKDSNLFKKYLKEVFVDLSTRVDSSNIKYMSRMTFYDYIKLPIFIAEKLFNAFSISKNKNGLKESEFVEGFFSLYNGTFEETVKIIFNLLDFDKDEIIKKEDVKIILSYLPLNALNVGGGEKGVSEFCGFQMKSLEEIEDIVTKTFKKYEDQMNLEQFIDTVQNKKSDVFLQIICFLYLEKPFSAKNIESLKQKYGQIEDDEYDKMVEAHRRGKKAPSVKIKTPSKGSILSPAGSFFKRRFSIHGFSLNNDPPTGNEGKEEGMNIPRSMKHINRTEIKKDINDINNSMSNSKNLRGNRKGSGGRDDNNNSVAKKLNLTEINNYNKNEDDKEISKAIDEVSNVNINSKTEGNINKNKIDPYNKNIAFVRLNNERTLENKNSLINKSKGATTTNTVSSNNAEEIKKLVDSSRQRYSSPTKYLQDKASLNPLALMSKDINYDKYLRPINEDENEINNNINLNNLSNNPESNEFLGQGERNICYENFVYKLTDNNKIRKFYLALINKDIYYYKTEDKSTFLGMHNLSGCFVQEGGENDILVKDGKTYYTFEIFFNNKSKTRKYFTTDIEIMKNFVQKIKDAIGYMKFSDYYEMKEIIGKGKFGVVNLGIHKKTQQKVAIKIINKDSIKTAEDKELVRIEIGILKLCHHPNIVRLLDHLENIDYIFIVMEYIEGGTLGQYFKKKNFIFSELQATKIMEQISSGVKYLHQYGIVHRDLKPDNIMITQQNDFGIIKIMDFGLSKIVSPQEKMVDGYGTLSYVAPEVLLRTPYNKEVDIWSMGVILYYMLSGHLPFKGNKEVVIAEKIVNDELEFEEEEWEVRSKKVKELIISCLKKEPKERISIEEFINHPWFKKNMKQKNSV